MSNVLFKSGTSTKFATITPDQNTFYWLTDNNELYFGAKKITNAADLSAAVTRLGTAEGKITALETLTELLDGANNVEGSIKYQIKAAIEALDGSATIASKNSSTNVVTIKAGITEADGVVSNSSDADIVLAAVAATGSAADVAVDNSDAGTTAVTVQAAIKELKSGITSLNTDSVVTLEQDATATTGMLKTYSLYQGDISDSTKKAAALVGKIDIPKDFLVKSGKIVTISSNVDSDSDATSGLSDGTYIKLVINSKDGDDSDSKIYINVANLVDVYTAAQNASEVQLAVNGYTLSASIVDVDAGKVTYIAADAQAEPAVARESVKQALQRLDGADNVSGSVSKKIKDAIEALDATVSIADAQGTNPLNIEITQADGVITGVTGSIDANTFDSYGSAAAVLGTNADDADDVTVYGVKAKVEDLEEYVGTIPAESNQTDVIGYVDYKTGAGVNSLNGSATIFTKSGNAVTLRPGVAQSAGVISNSTGDNVTLADIAVSGAAINASIADAGSVYDATTVEAALQEVKLIADANATALTWQEF